MKSGSEQELITLINFSKTFPMSQLGEQNGENSKLNGLLTNNLNYYGLIFIKFECKLKKKSHV